ncbi:Radical SAM superfamily enzyme YgiQ, UPF0313 family [Paucidesulfovibrio gracilis DSM 16080]|uniref:Radical SAM superfamily enzyme YgiQ, UPF0313 family n=1 Tax=Paucidesulfovibrio gracilis DSM 16080 TaxID=1121449 RepID=A0A1T4W6R3_9BACT|nr:radical SAM protein [Paucidesulfovibrio gracilis]SKA72401.1 Radical SAM superfamily enzyme YgiQ, UPF0313 family [Paucidesulfovibrio gracilis DSM 16080]
MRKSRIYHGDREPSPRETGGRLPTALIIPMERRVALSTLGWQAVYRQLAENPGMAPERCFTLGRDGEPTTMESGTPLSRFPVLALSVNFEEDLLHLLRTLEASGVPSRREERPDYPLIMVGGPLAFMNPAPLAPMTDCFFVGEAEAGLADVFSKFREVWLQGGDKNAMLDAVAAMPGIYAPGRSAVPVRRVIAPGASLNDPAWSCFISPDAVFRDTLLLEANRGCPYACRFCAAGYVYRPPRQASLEELQAVVEQAEPPKVGLVGTALTDLPHLLPFLNWLRQRGTKFSLSSVRADGVTEELLTILRQSGVRTVTLALEGPSRRLRDQASKKLKEEDFLRAVALCARHGVNHLKTYCIVGWPGETDADYEELGGFLGEIARTRDENLKRQKEFMRVTLGTSCLVPKPHTPFQWMAMASAEELDRRQHMIREMLKPYKGFRLEADKPFQARLQGLLARGGESIFDFVELAARHGGWKKALKRWQGDPAHELDRERSRDEALPWDVIDVGVTKEHLWQEWERAKRFQPSPKCVESGCDQCRRCGMDCFLREQS